MPRRSAITLLLFTASLVLISCADETNYYVVGGGDSPTGPMPPTAFASPEGGVFDTTVSVTLTSPEGATIYYSLDGSEPLITSTQYTTTIDITDTGITLLRFLPVDAEGNTGEVTNETYCITGTPQSTIEIFEYSYSPQIAIDSTGAAHVIWAEEVIPMSMQEILYMNSSAWGTSINASNLPGIGLCTQPAMAIDSGNVAHIAWSRVTAAGYDIEYTNSASWGTTLNISNTPKSPAVPKGSGSPFVAVDSSDTVHLTFSDKMGTDPRYTYHADSSNWATTSVMTHIPGDASGPSMLITPDDTMHMAWSENTGSRYNLYYANSSDWVSTQTLVAEILGTVFYRSMAVDSKGVAHFVWELRFWPGYSDIYYKNTDMPGEEPVNLSESVFESRSASITISPDDVVHVAWIERYDPTDTGDIYRAKIYSPETIAIVKVTDTTNKPTYLDIASDSSGNIHMLWMDRESSTYYLYYLNSGK
jgi:hypothetical protein